MAYSTPSTQELIDRNLARIESALGVTSPIADRAFNRAWATVEGLAASGMYAFALDAARNNLAISASEDGLGLLSQEYNVPRRQATAWRGSAVISLAEGVPLPAGTAFTAENGYKYETTGDVTGGAAGTVTVGLVCKQAGPDGNIAVGATLSIQSVIEGAGREAVVTGITALGLEQEDLEDWRVRILDVIRGGSGGSDISGASDTGTGEESGTVEVNVPACVNSNDYRLACEAVGGVARAYPFAGPPLGSGITPWPGMRTVYIECQSDIESDGIPPQSLLDLVRAAIIADPITGLSREILGVPVGPDLLFVEPIVNTGIYVTVIGLFVNDALAAAQNAVTDAVRKLLLTFAPFVQGLDADFDRHNELSESVLAQTVQNTLDHYGGNARRVIFGGTPGGSEGRYIL
jgi:hypothetical protein